MKIWLYKEIDKIGIMLKRKRDRKVVPLLHCMLLYFFQQPISS